HLIGICRGSQLLCALHPDGKLVQHQANPAHHHEMLTHDGRCLVITSSHHQAQYPFDMDKEDYKLLAWTTDTSPFHLDGNEKEMNPQKECEIVFYPRTRALAIQGHPEWMDMQSDTVTYLRQMLNNHLENKI